MFTAFAASCSEIYSVGKSVEVVVKLQGEDVRLRLETLKNELGTGYTVRSYREEVIAFQGEFTGRWTVVNVWRKYEMPAVTAEYEENALRQALELVRERMGKVEGKH